MLSKIIFVMATMSLLVPGERAGTAGHLLAKGGVTEENIGNSGSRERDCFLFEENGSFHIESRRQKDPQPVSSLVIYEGTLTSKQLEELRSLLKTVAEDKLPQYVSPQYPLATASSERFVLTLPYEGGTRQLGYFETSRSEAVHASTDEVRKNWSSSKTALLPIHDWFKRFAANQTKPTTSSKMSCNQP